MARDEGLAAREAALAVVKAALARRAGLEEGLAGLSGLDARDRGFAHMLAMTTLRRLGQIDHILASKINRPPPAEVSDLLRIGLAQILFMDVPGHAAVATTMAMAERKAGSFKGLINGVLRGLVREPPTLEAKRLAPDWLFARWSAAYGEAQALRIAETIADEPAMDLTLRDPADAEALAPLLEAEALPGGTLRTRRGGDVSAWPGYAEGRWWVQDAAAAVPARLLDVKTGETALDLCSAPGGKTLQLAAAGAAVTSLDKSKSRLARVRENLDRTGLSAEIVTADAATWSDPRTFDAVLLDAPCSATGTFRRHPDVLWAARPGDIASLAGLQAKLLDAAAAKVAPGGRMVYCVCSLELEEGEGQVEAFLKRRPEFSLSPITPGEGGSPPAAATPRGWLRILPDQLDGGLDGFFIARLVR